MIKVWSTIYPHDTLERIHITSFMESAFDNPHSDYYHTHIFLIPRSKELGKLIRRKLNAIEQYIPGMITELLKELEVETKGISLITSINLHGES